MNAAQRVRRFIGDRVRDYGPGEGVRLAVHYAREALVGTGRLMHIRPPGARHTVSIRARTSDMQVFDQIFGRREVEFGLTSPPSLIVDAGANIGLASVYFAIRFPRARIVALEIDDGNFELLVGNVAAYPNVVPMKRGLWSHRTSLVIENPQAEQWAFRGAERKEGHAESRSIPALGVLDLLSELGASRIDLLKMDIEGGEREVLGESARSWIDKIDTLAVELHDRWVPGCTEALTSAISLIPNSVTDVGEYKVVRFRH